MITCGVYNWMRGECVNIESEYGRLIEPITDEDIEQMYPEVREALMGYVDAMVALRNAVTGAKQRDARDRIKEE